jgi:hypothetical protein
MGGADVSVQRQWVLIGAAFVAVCALIPLVPLLTGIDGQLVMSGGTQAADAHPRPVPHRTVLVLDLETRKVAAMAVTDASGHFSCASHPVSTCSKHPAFRCPTKSAANPVLDRRHAPSF